MDGNLAYQESPRMELLNGKIVMMSSPSVNHYQIIFNIVLVFQSYLNGRKREPFRRCEQHPGHLILQTQCGH